MTPVFCSSPLSEHLYRNLAEVSPFLILGLTGIWGWGLAYEKWILRTKPSGMHAYFAGTVIVAGLRLLTSLTGVVYSSWPIAVVGSLFLLSTVTSLKRPLTFNSDFYAKLGLAFFGVLFGVLILHFPVPVGDQQAIWSYHAKALSCETLFGADYIRERYWTWSHPEYPLYYSFLHSYFFTLQNSFRDDVVRIWQAMSVVVIGPLLYRSLRRYITAGWFAALCVFSVYFVLQNKGRDGAPELCCALFSLLIASCLLERDFARLPLYLFGLATIKNEGTVSAVIFAGLVSVFYFKHRETTAQERTTLKRVFLASAVLVFGWAAVASRLPSFHEQYHLRAFSLAIWQAGITSIPTILGAYVKSLFGFPWLYLTLSIFACGYLARRSRWEPAFSVIAIWPLTMLGVFFVIYVISPWGENLHSITLYRLLLQVLCPWLLLVGILLFRGLPDRGRVVVGVFYCLLYVSGAFHHHVIYWGKHYVHWVLEDPLTPSFKEFDRTLPVPARVGYFRLPDLFGANYLLYPRKLYSCPPDKIQGTWRGVYEWESREQIDPARYHFDAIIDGEKLVWKR